MGTSGNVFESPPAQGGLSSTIFNNSKILASSFGREGMREAQSSAILTPRFDQGAPSLNPFFRTGGTYSFNGMMDYPRFQISGMHLGKFPDSNEVSKLESQLQD